MVDVDSGTADRHSKQTAHPPDGFRARSSGVGPARALRRSFHISWGLLWLALPVHAADDPDATYLGSRFSTVRAEVFQTPYAELPTHPVSRQYFGSSGETSANHLLAAARRTLRSEQDLYTFPQGRKLLQANGICFAGEWLIDRVSPYTGQLATDTRSLAIARASVTLGEPRRGHKRTFAMAVKLFPTRDPDARVRTVNLLVMDDLSGSRADHFTDAVMDNEPALGGLPPLRQIATARRLLKDLKAADRLAGATEPDATFRPVTALAAGADPAVSPRWLRLRVTASTARVDAADFRDELRLEHYPGRRLEWRIEAAGAAATKARAEWLRIGTLVLRESVTSAACDNRLHFAHPRLDS